MSHGTTGSDDARNDFVISVANEQSRHAVDEEQLAAAMRAVLAKSPFSSANVSLAIVDDPTIHQLNRRYLEHDWPTDVLSFVLDERDGHLEGEVILSADTAAASAAEIGWSVAAEQLLYAIHGALHLAGYDDKTAADARAMRAAEVEFLRGFGIEGPQHAERGRAVGGRSTARSYDGASAK